MKCLKCGKKVLNSTCQSCGFNICSQCFSSIYKIDSKSANAISGLVESSQVSKYDNERIDYDDTTENSAIFSNKKVTDTPNESHWNKAKTPVTTSRRKIPLPFIIIAICALISLAVIKHIDLLPSPDNGVVMVSADASIGDTIAFGNYEQDANLTNGSELIQWGPQRTTFTMESPPTYPTFNSITDNPTIGDERNFVRIGKIDSKETILTDNVEIEAGEKYLVYIYFHNNASATFNDKEHNHSGVAFQAKLSSSFPSQISETNPEYITATITSDNATPKDVWNSVRLTCTSGNVNLSYVDGSAKIYNDWATNGQVLSTDLFTYEGTYLGLNELDGVILGGEEYHGIVTYVLQADAK